MIQILVYIHTPQKKIDNNVHVQLTSMIMVPIQFVSLQCPAPKFQTLFQNDFTNDNFIEHRRRRNERNYLTPKIAKLATKSVSVGAGCYGTSVNDARLFGSFAIARVICHELTELCIGPNDYRF